MKAVRLVQIGKPLEMQEVPVPPVGDDDILVRVKAAGICHSDVHYRAGTSPVRTPPVTPGHEVSGIVEQTGSVVSNVKAGDRVALHYLVTCGKCFYCTRGNEQFCVAGEIIGKHRDGGYAEYIVVPARNAVPLPDEIPFEHGAVLMCSSATSFHALRKARLQPGETVAVFGAGGLGMSALQLARVFGAVSVYAVDINDEKLALAERYGATPVNASKHDPVVEIRRLTDGKGVDVALEVIGLPQTMEQAVRSLGIFGRAVMVGITQKRFEVDSYHDLIGKEAQVMGCNDHLLEELFSLVRFVQRGWLDLSHVITRTVSLEAKAINEVMDALEHFGSGVRAVIRP